MEQYDLYFIEQELKKRLIYPYEWGGTKQTNFLDSLTGFIYNIASFEDLLKEIEKRFKESREYKLLFNYSLNRWFNFWSSQAVEQIFCSIPNVEPNKNSKDKLVDFKINGIQFDHKTTVFPKQYNFNLESAKKEPKKLISWLYLNQSQEGRKHLKNRLFIVLYSKNGDHWRLKAEISWLKKIILKYLEQFNQNNLIKIDFENEQSAYSDIIWAVKD